MSYYIYFALKEDQSALLDFVPPGSVSLHQRREEVEILLNQSLHLSEEIPASIYAEFNPKNPMIIFAAYMATYHDSVLYIGEGSRRELCT